MLRDDKLLGRLVQPQVQVLPLALPQEEERREAGELPCVRGRGARREGQRQQRQEEVACCHSVRLSFLTWQPFVEATRAVGVAQPLSIKVDEQFRSSTGLRCKIIGRYQGEAFAVEHTLLCKEAAAAVSLQQQKIEYVKRHQEARRRAAADQQQAAGEEEAEPGRRVVAEHMLQIGECDVTGIEEISILELSFGCP